MVNCLRTFLLRFFVKSAEFVVIKETTQKYFATESFVGSCIQLPQQAFHSSIHASSDENSVFSISVFTDSIQYFNASISRIVIVLSYNTSNSLQN